MRDTINIDSIASDSAAADSAAVDTVVVGEELIPVTLEHTPEGIEATPRPDTPLAASWIILAVLAVLVTVCLRYKSNVKYFKILLHDLTNVRERGNIFDDTANETSFMLMLNMLCAVTGGLMLFTGLHTAGVIGVTADTFAGAAWGCMGATAAYCVVMPIVYWIVGMVFTTPLHTRLWVKGFTASQALLGIMLIAPAMVALFYPEAAKPLIVIALIILGLVKLLFITKTFRFFFAQFSSWVVFLYYLCTLEILPLLLTYTAAIALAG